MEKTAQKVTSKQKNTTMAILAYIIFFLPLLTDAKKDSFVKYHVKQGLVLFVFAVIAWFIIMVIPIIGWILAPFLDIFIIVMAVIGIMGAAKGEEKPLPLIGQYADKLKF